MIRRAVRRFRILVERTCTPRAALRRAERDLRARPKVPGSRFAVVHYWDTREKLRRYWRLNARIVEHNFETLEARAAPASSIRHFIVLHEVTSQPDVEALIGRLARTYSVDVLRIHLDLAGVGHSHKLNLVVKESLDGLGARLRDHDFVLMTAQDILFANHFPENPLEMLARVAKGPSDSAADLLHETHVGDGYVSHTIGAEPDWSLFTHNAAFGRGFFPIEKLPYVERSARRSADWIPGEQYLGEVLGQRCAYLRPHPLFYHGDYPMEHLTPRRTDELLALARDPTGTRKLMAAAQRHWAGGLRAPWLGDPDPSSGPRRATG